MSVWLSLLLARESRRKPVGYFFDNGIRCWKPQQCGQRTCLVLRWSQKHKLRRRFVKTSVLPGFTSWCVGLVLPCIAQDWRHWLLVPICFAFCCRGAAWNQSSETKLPPETPHSTGQHLRADQLWGILHNMFRCSSDEQREVSVPPRKVQRWSLLEGPGR